MKKTAARLADGREILYFDEHDDAVRVLREPGMVFISDATPESVAERLRAVPPR